MRCLYREKRIECGNYLEVDIYPGYKKQQGRGKKLKLTSEVMQKHNENNSRKTLERLINTNFTSSDSKAELTYAKGNEPEDDKTALRDMQRFVRRLKYWYTKKYGIELKYVIVIEKGTRSGRYHLHIVISGGISPAELASVWGFGYIMKFQPLQFDETGCAGLAYYLSGNKRGQKLPALLYRRYYASRNLKKPKEQVRDGAISQRKVRELATFPLTNREEFEKRYPGYRFTDCEVLMNDFNGGFYLCVRMHKKDAVFSAVSRTRRKEGST